MLSWALIFLVIAISRRGAGSEWRCRSSHQHCLDPVCHRPGRGPDLLHQRPQAAGLKEPTQQRRIEQLRIRRPSSLLLLEIGRIESRQFNKAVEGVIDENPITLDAHQLQEKDPRQAWRAFEDLVEILAGKRTGPDVGQGR